MLQTEHSLSTGLRRTRLSLPLGTQGPVPAVGLKPQERRASARRSCEKDGQNERRRVKATDDGPPMRRRGGMRPETLGMSPRDDHLVILVTQGRNGAAGLGYRSTLGLYRPPAPRLGAGATTILARFFAPSACTGLRVAPMRRYIGYTLVEAWTYARPDDTRCEASRSQP